MAHKETMTSKQRVLRNYSFESIDRFSIDWCACSEVYESMARIMALQPIWN